jgi:hypothetical protein
LLGFHPANSLVVIGTQPSSRKIAVTMRYDLPDPPDPRLAAQIDRHAAAVLAAGHAEEAVVVVVGYGPDELVTTIVGKLQTHKTPRLPLTEVLRVAGGRYWSYRCAEPRCCPAEGTPFDPAAEPADATLAAKGPVLGSRDELAATVAPVGGKTAGVMRRATAQAEQRAAELLARPTPGGAGTSTRSGIALAGVEAVAQAVACYRSGGQLSAGNDVAWLTLALRDLRVRDDAWSRMLPEHRKAHLRLWLDLSRLAQPGYVAAPASLLALIAWQFGNGTLANVALDRGVRDTFVGVPHLGRL